ncbi:DUF5753 domain-containing protein [Actinomadura hibisca]|uniref:DUF5753 domain-containing protein n=1 Tax=Actinomadura hibisca TaxID=68565 RepID=UPI00082A220C|nr:DUF5753 domain-containing protein [Actinomadura hibisca]
MIPGLFQTSAYATARMGRFNEFHGFPGDLADAVEARMERQRVVRSGRRTFAVVLEESAPWFRIGSRVMMREQLDHLRDVATWPQVSLGVIPRDRARRIWSVPTFWIFDGRRVITETPTAELTITAPGEVEIYRRVFAEVVGLDQPLITQFEDGRAEGEGLATSSLSMPTVVVRFLRQLDPLPHDRVHATCAVSRVPPAWIEQTRPGGVIVLPYSPGFGFGTVLRLDVVGDGTAVGRFCGLHADAVPASRRRAARLLGLGGR